MRIQTDSNGSEVPVVLLGPGHGYASSWPNFRQEKQRQLSRGMLLAVAAKIADGQIPETAIDIYSQAAAQNMRHLVRAIRKA